MFIELVIVPMSFNFIFKISTLMIVSSGYLENRVAKRKASVGLNSV